MCCFAQIYFSSSVYGCVAPECGVFCNDGRSGEQCFLGEKKAFFTALLGIAGNLMSE